MKVSFNVFEIITPEIHRHKLNEAINNLNKIRAVHSKLEQPFMTEITKLKNECKHYYKSYNSDASGNNDWFYYCPVCGAYGKDL